MLALQRSAGNRAVSAMLACDAVAEKADASATGTGTATLTGIGVVPLLAFSIGDSSGRGKSQSEFTFTSRLGPHSAKLAKALADGTIMDVDVVLSSG